MNNKYIRKEYNMNDKNKKQNKKMTKNEKIWYDLMKVTNGDIENMMSKEEFLQSADYIISLLSYNQSDLIMKMSDPSGDYKKSLLSFSEALKESVS